MSTMKPIIDEFSARLGEDAIQSQNHRDDPNYYAETPQDLATSAQVHSFSTGTGEQLWESFLPIIESTCHELIIVTCFWATSPTLTKLSSTLRSLSSRHQGSSGEKIRVRICFSSSSIFQKLFHSQNASGQSYAPDSWHKQLGLPPASELPGLDLQIKSIFQLPFSVMHPKFIIVDRQAAILPSCNISWESWFEGATVMIGPIVHQFLAFYAHFWERTSDLPDLGGFDMRMDGNDFPVFSTPSHGPLGPGPAQHIVDFSAHSPIGTETATIFLPSPHHRNPRFQPFSSQAKTHYPHTPLNTFLLLAFSRAERSIAIYTPNLTTPPVLWALLAALKRGVHVRITTSANLMVLEQLVTAGTTTARCVRKLIKRYKKLASQASRQDKSARARVPDEEACLDPDSQASQRIGGLQIDFFSPRGGPKERGQENGEPQQIHLKMSVVDDDVLVLGSGNMDRASWYTSQELGVAFFEREIVGRVREAVDGALKGRTERFFDSRAGSSGR